MTGDAGMDKEHYPVWRSIGYQAGIDTEYEEICVCGTCVPKHSHFASRADVPEWPCPESRITGHGHSASHQA